MSCDCGGNTPGGEGCTCQPPFVHPEPFGWLFGNRPAVCPKAPHRGPQGPNEDLGQCMYCGDLSHRMRSSGEAFGSHAADCSLPVVHPSFCVGGGTGHAEAKVIRG